MTLAAQCGPSTAYVREHLCGQCGPEMLATAEVGVGLNHARARRRSTRAARSRQNRRTRGSIWLRTPLEDSRPPVSREEEPRISADSVGSDSNSSSNSSSGEDNKQCLSPLVSSPGSVPVAAHERLLLLRRRRDGLLDITLRTVKLMRRNQQLQHRLAALQAETRAFVRSVLSNPENQGLSMLLDKRHGDLHGGDSASEK